MYKLFFSERMFRHNSYATSVIEAFGTEKQKSKYLPKIYSGEIKCAFCCADKGSGCDIEATNTTAKFEGDKYTIRGEKTWVSNASDADLFLVFAKTRSHTGIQHHHLSAFLIDKREHGTNK